jgi:hypothetical protein
MALSPNYGWSEPDNSSLVKNGAQDIRTLGDSIDTSVWNIGFGQAGKNKIINGEFDFWQRGTSFTITTSTLTYTADRWYSHILGATVGCTVSQQTFTPGTAPVAGYEGQFFIRQNVTTLTTQSIQALGQRIEDVRTFAGQTVTVSFYAKADASRNYTSRFVQNFGSGGSSEVVTSTGATHALTTSWQRFTVSVAVPSVSGKTIGTSSYLAILVDGPSNTANTLDVWGFQIEYGSKATPFQTASGGSLQGELAMCQRYYLDTRNGSDQPFSGYSNSTDYLLANVRYPVTMRSTPSVTIGQASGSNYVRRISTNAQIAITVTSYPGTNPGGFSAVYCAAAPFVAAVGYDFYILASAEL